MTRRALILLFLAACMDDAADETPDVSETESASTSTQGSSYQGSSYQGSSYQGSSYQGSSYQGSSYQGSSYQGMNYGGIAVTGSVSSKTTIETWRQSLKTGAWEYRSPERLCTYSANFATTTCTSYNLATQQSPLAGLTFPTTFIDPTTQQQRTGKIRIKYGVGSVRRDYTEAMHPLNGANSLGSPQHTYTCTHPDGCRKNDDLYLYQVELVDDDNVTTVPFCPGGGQAFAINGLWTQTGARITSGGQFTFACTRGTIAKCMRWGYRPFGVATKTNGETVSMADYHQACIRAAAADYCANGHSFTKDGTLIDIYDYQPHQSYASGFIPRTLSQTYQWSTTFVWESTFDRQGGTELDFVRYQELGSLMDACPDAFSLGTAPMPGEYHIPMLRDPSTWSGPRISVDSTVNCSHSEETLGRWLHPSCSKCTYHLWEKFGNLPCLGASGTWDASCRKLARDNCSLSSTGTYPEMAIHSECSTGAALYKYDSACTLDICGDPLYASCCSTGWNSTCTAVANSRCRGGREGGTSMFGDPIGFCGVAIPLGNDLSTL